MKQLLATTALVLLAAGPTALRAQDAPAAGTAAEGASGAFVETATTGDFFGSDLIGMDIYATEDEFTGDETVTADARAGWDDIGEIDDLLVSQDGEVEAVIVDIGGFLGMGEHTVAVDMSQIHMLTDENGVRFAALTADRSMLEGAPAFERSEAAMQATPPAADTLGAAPMEPEAPDAMAAGDPAAGMEGYVPLAAEEITAERLQGAAIYNREGESIGEVSELVLDADGRITEAVVDVGGFLGLGEHSVGLAFDELDVTHHPESGDLRVYIDATEEDLRQRPAREG